MAAALAALPALPIAQAHAAGLGKLTVLSGLGQPLRAELDISAAKEEVPSLTARIATQESFRQANIEYSTVLSGLRFTLDKRSNGQPYFRIASDRAIGEPFLDILVELSWSSGRLVREYTFLLDPPEFNKPAAETPSPVLAPVTAPVAPPVQRTEVEKPMPVEKPVAAEKPPLKAAAASQPAQVAQPAQEKPVRASKAPVVASTEGPSEGQGRAVRKGDTLGKIAAESRHDGVSLDQMLVALFRSNQEAFDGGNMNRLKAGKILSIPEKDAVAAIDAKEARKIVVTQSGDFEAYRRKLAGAVADAAPAKEEMPKQASSGKIAPKVEDKAPVAAGKDKLQVSKTEASGDAAKLKAQEEEKVAKAKALKDAQSRIAELEKNVADMNKLAALKSQAAADLQKQAAAKPVVAAEAAKKPEAAKPVESAKPAEPVKPAEAVKADAVKAVEPAKAEVKTEVKADEAGKIEVPVEAAKPDEPVPAKPKPAAAKPAPVAPQPEPDFIDDNAPLVFGGGGLLALLAGYLGFNAWRRKKNAQAVAATDSVLSASSVLDLSSSEGFSRIDEQPSEFGPADITSFGSGEGVDPIREADTFMAYGRDAQAEEILVDALSKTPENLPVYLKLLEIYAARKSVGQFNTIAQSLHAQTGGIGSEWERAASLGLVIDPANPLYGAVVAQAPELTPVMAEVEAPVEEVIASTPLVEASPASEQVAALDLDFDLAGGEEALAAPTLADEASEVTENMALDMDLAAPAAEPEEVATPATDEVASLDFDLDLGEPAAPTAVEPVPAPAAEADNGFDIDFDLGDLTSAAPAAESAPEPSPTEVAADTHALDVNVLDFDFDLTAPVAEAEAAPVAAEVEPAALDVDFDLDLGEPAAAPALITEVDSAAALDFNFDLEPGATALPDLDIALNSSAETAAPALDLSGISLDLSEPLPADTEAAPMLDLSADLGGATDVDRPEVATKLELAQAYEEMGDKEGAKELFQEVLTEGSTAQQQIAREKLALLG